MVDQRTEFEIALKDSITPQLQNISKQLKELNRLAKESGEGSSGAIDQIRKSNDQFARSAREGLRHFTEIGKTIIDFGKDLLGVGGIVTSVKQMASSLDDFAQNTANLSAFAQNTHLAADQIKSMRDAMSAMGIRTEQADKYIGSLTDKLKGLQAFRESSPLFQDLAKMGDKGAAFGKKLLGDVNLGDYKKAVEDIMEFYAQQSPRAKIYLAQVFGVPQSVLERMPALQKEIDARIGERYKEDEDISDKYLINKTILMSRWESEWNRFADHALTDINKFWEDVNKSGGGHTFSDWMNQEWDLVTKTVTQDIEDFKALKSLYDKTMEFFQKANKAEMPSVMKWLGWGEPIDKEHAQEKKDNAQAGNKALEDIDLILKRMSGQSPAETGYGGAYGGNLQATGGGFRPGRAGRASGDGTSAEQAAAERPVAGQKEYGKASPGGDAPAGSGYNYFQHHGHNYPFARSELEDIKTPYGNATVHPQAAADLKGLMDELKEGGAPIKNLGSYNPRPKRWGGGPSSHGMGTAWDIDDATQLSPAMKEWIKNNPDKWEAAKRRWNIGQPLPEKDAPHLEWRGPHGSKVEEARKTLDGKSVWDQPSAAIKFNFNNVPPGVKTNADASGVFDQVTVEHKKAAPQAP
jgi:hypothetical protein